jgi:hypothetical protein
MKTIPMAYRILAVLILCAAVWGHGYTKGLARESDRRDAVELQAEKKAHEDFMRALSNGRSYAKAAIEWRQKARNYYQKWQEKLNDTPDPQLSECIPVPSSTPTAAHMCMLSADWVGLYNDAWFPDGMPRNTGGAVDLSVGTGPATPREALGNIQTNAESCAEDRQRQRKLIDLLRGNRHADADKSPR